MCRVGGGPDAEGDVIPAARDAHLEGAHVVQAVCLALVFHHGRNVPRLPLLPLLGPTQSADLMVWESQLPQNIDNLLLTVTN